jgi:signal transduction histidine kinase
MIKAIDSRLALVTFLTGLALALVFVGLVLKLRNDLSDEVTDKMVARAAGILQPVVQRQFDREIDAQPGRPVSSLLVSALLGSYRQTGMIAMAVFDADGATLESVPANQLLVELPIADFVRLSNGSPITRFHHDFPLAQLGGLPVDGERTTPVLEVVLPLYGRNTPRPVGFVRYHLDARQLDADLGVIGDQIQQQTRVTLTIGIASFVIVLAGAFYALRRAQLTLKERNAKLVKTEVELALAARTSAMGQVASNLMHSIQGAIAGLRSAVASGQAPDWESVSDYTARLNSMTQEALTLLGDLRSNATYSLSGDDLRQIILERNQPAAKERGIVLNLDCRLEGSLDNLRGGIICLIAGNLIQNAIQASPAQSVIDISLGCAKGQLFLRVNDKGPGIAEPMRDKLFQPGATTRPGGTGLGLALSRLLARQINGELILSSSGPEGSCFELRIPA